MNRWLIIAGLVLVGIGLLWPWLSKLPLGRLPGDIAVQKDGFSFYFPLMTSLVISVLLSILIWLFNRSD
ncbi:MAG: hypothetical protein RLZZ09_1618 [Pseudomonadota bacterium]|jgi:hypothetical protein